MILFHNSQVNEYQIMIETILTFVEANDVTNDDVDLLLSLLMELNEKQLKEFNQFFDIC
jgi:hypothetical protein